MNRCVARRIGFIAVGIDRETPAISNPQTLFIWWRIQVDVAIGPSRRWLCRPRGCSSLRKQRHHQEQNKQKNQATKVHEASRSAGVDVPHLQVKLAASFVLPVPLYFAT